MAFTNGQLVTAPDLNNLSITTLTTTGNASIGGTLSVTGAATTSTINGQTISAAANLTGTLAVASTLSPAALVDISGAAAGQIKFPASQNASSNANTLDDYEEGTWTPVIGGSGGTSGQTYSSQIGHYVKVGPLVIANFDVTLSNKGTITDTVQIQGLPFTSKNTGGFFGSVVGYFANLATTWVLVKTLVNTNASTANLYGATAGASTLSALVAADIGNTSRIVGVEIYLAAA